MAELPKKAKVVIIGGGDTGADCLGTAHRQRAASIHQFEIMPRPPETRAASTPWPTYATGKVLRIWSEPQAETDGAVERRKVLLEASPH